MKTLKLILTTTVAVLTLSSAAFALPAWKGGPVTPAMTKSDFGTLKSGDQVVLVCKASNSVTVIDIKDRKSAMELCKAGKMVHCPFCKMDYKVSVGNLNGKGTANQSTVVAVNEKGEPCMFFAKLIK